MRRRGFARPAGFLLAAAVGISAEAGTPPAVRPVYHGTLKLDRPAVGSIDRRIGRGVVRVRRWSFKPNDFSNGVFPDREPIVVAFGNDTFAVPDGRIRARGRAFAYAAHPLAPSGVRSLRLQPRADGSWLVRFVVAGVDLETLATDDPICIPFAIIVGDDDGFSGVSITSRSFRSSRVAIPSSCTVGGDWPWLQ